VFVFCLGFFEKATTKVAKTVARKKQIDLPKRKRRLRRRRRLKTRLRRR
jgi:hypothetical protein